MPNAVSGTVSLQVVIWCNYDTRSKREKNASLAQIVQDLIHARDRQLIKSANAVELLVV